MSFATGRRPQYRHATVRTPTPNYEVPGLANWLGDLRYWLQWLVVFLIISRSIGDRKPYIYLDHDLFLPHVSRTTIYNQRVSRRCVAHSVIEGTSVNGKETQTWARMLSRSSGLHELALSCACFFLVLTHPDQTWRALQRSSFCQFQFHLCTNTSSVVKSDRFGLCCFRH